MQNNSRGVKTWQRPLFQQILAFYEQLDLDDQRLPAGFAPLNPYKEQSPALSSLLKEFYKRFYNDQKERFLLLGINPGRLGAGATGIPFTDSPALKTHCGLEPPVDTREVSAEFVYRFIQAYGGPARFYQRWFIGAVCPLGFVRQNAKGNWVNANYYDDPALEAAVRPFIYRQMEAQRALCGRPRKAVVLGSGKNYQYLKKHNQEQRWFEEVIPLEHPRFIMQYRRKQLEAYLTKFLSTVQEVERG